MLCTGGAAQVALAITCPTCWALLPTSAQCTLVRCPTRPQPHAHLQSTEQPHPSHELPALPLLTSHVSRELPLLPRGGNGWGAATTLMWHTGTALKGWISCGMTPTAEAFLPYAVLWCQNFWGYAG